MRIRVQVVIESDQETTPLHSREVACFNRGELTPETLGLRLSEAKQILAGVQQAMTAQQVEGRPDLDGHIWKLPKTRPRYRSPPCQQSDPVAIGG